MVGAAPHHLASPKIPHLSAPPTQPGLQAGRCPAPLPPARGFHLYPKTAGPWLRVQGRGSRGSWWQSVPTWRGPGDKNQSGPQKQQQWRPPARAPASSSAHGAAP